MSLNRYACARDANEAQIVMAYVRAGATVCKLDEPCDLLVGYEGVTYLVEVKRPAGPQGGTKGRRLTKAQASFAESWLGGPMHVVTTPSEALAVLGLEAS